jgi:BirA family biotin operon repressor/biotin-[acetyl-CoA-carboxylase] ligase
MQLENLHKALHNTPVTELRAFDEIGSTNDEALQWLEEGAPDFSLVIADLQTRGRGRFERRWVTRPGTSLAFTVIFRPAQKELNVPVTLFAPLCGLAVQQALHENFNLCPQVKWPNDILLERQKCCGILVEAAWTGDRLNGIVMGIGINIQEGSLPPQDTALFPATYLERFTQKPVDRFFLLAKILNALQYWRRRLGTEEFFTFWRRNLAFLGEEVRIEQHGEPVKTGRETGIDNAGNLLLLDASGATITVEVGDVHLRTKEEVAPQGRRNKPC